MRLRSNQGLTLAELLVALSITALLSGATVSILTAALQSHAFADSRSAVQREAIQAMTRMGGHIRRTSYLMIPNAHATTRDILAVSGTVNEDNDFYFGDVLFPRIDEDSKKQMTNDNKAGIKDYDDDGDGTVDEGNKNDDDEDGLVDEDWLDGIDNDGDGNIDEDTGDGNIADMDDDGDGSVDEGDANDDDEDGTTDEDGLNPIIYVFDSGANTLTEHLYDAGGVTERVLSSNVSAFSATYEVPNVTHGPRVFLSLTLLNPDGVTITLEEYAYPRNILQKSGKRVL